MAAKTYIVSCNNHDRFDAFHSNGRGFYGLSAGLAAFILLYFIPFGDESKNAVIQHSGQISTASITYEYISILPDTGFPVLDVTMPFPGTPIVSESRTPAGKTTNFLYDSPNSGIKYIASVATDIPAVANPSASFIKGFSRGQNVIENYELEIGNLGGEYISFIAVEPRESVWHIFAFEHKGNVYIWGETFEPQYKEGYTKDNFFENLKRIKVR